MHRGPTLGGDTRGAIIAHANEAIEVRDLGELRELANAVNYVSRGHTRGLDELDRQIARARSPRDAERLEGVRRTCVRLSVLPQEAPPRPRAKASCPGSWSRGSSLGGGSRGYDS